MKLLEKQVIEKIRRRQIRMIAEQVANKLNIPKEEDYLVYVIGSGQERTNIEVIKYWISCNTECGVLYNEIELAQELTVALEKELYDSYGQWL